MKKYETKKVLVACEESQRVCSAFRDRGFEAYSCDLIECSGGHPEWHIQQDVTTILNPINNKIEFNTVDGQHHIITGEWDLIIAHPPCTYLTVSGNRWFNIERYGDRARERWKLREEAANFFLLFSKASCKHIAIENPIGYMNSHFRKPNQTIQPYEFGHPERKATCLWLINLPILTPTDLVDPNITVLGDGKTYSDWHLKTLRLSKEERSKERSKTYPGIAAAMAQQWGDYILKENN